MPFVFEFLWRAYLRRNDARCRNAVIVTLTHICQGGIYDHLGGGFARYSTDRAWLAPHFEKMLYDNAQLIDLLAVVWQRERNPLFAARIAETVGWLEREMSGENGAFAAAFDADSEGEEGKFYVWTAAEIDALLGADADVFKTAYDVSTAGNWEGKVILNRTAGANASLPAEDEARLAECRKILLAARAKRVPPGRDDKILADWNGLAVSALAHAATAFGNAAWLDLARRVFAAIEETMTWTDAAGRTRLGHSLCRGRLQKTAMIDDYANMINAAVALYSATGERGYLARAEGWLETANALYWDDADGGYFFTAADAHDLFVRTKSASDNAVPSGNGRMVFALARLYYLTGRQTFRARAATAVEALEVEAMKGFPHGASLLNAYEFLERAVQVVIVGDRTRADTQRLLDAVSRAALPNLVLDGVQDGDDLPAGHPAKGKSPVGGGATAYVCRGPVCSAPQTDADGLRHSLAA